jgi:tetratricopeptide (TPR) repeat protein
MIFRVKRSIARTALAIAACGLCAGALWAQPGGSAGHAASPAQRSLVVPFENVNREGRLYWLAEASAILVTQNLDAAGQKPITRDERLRAFERLQLPTVASLSEATVIRVGQLVGASQVIMGSFAVEGSDLVVSARSVRLDTGRASAHVTERGRLESFFAIYEAVARRLLPAGTPAATVPATSREPVAVFENYVKGLLAENPAGQVRFLQGALSLLPQYDPARVALWQVYTAQGDHARAASAALAVPASSPLSRRARFLAALSMIRSRQYDEAFAGLKALLDEAPAAAVYNNLGVVQLLRGSTPQTGRATYFFNHAAEADREDPDCAFNLGYAYWFERDPQAAVYWLKEAVRRNPADGDAHYVIGVALQSTGALVEAEREKDLARQLSSKYREWERRPAPAGEQVPKGLERLREDLDAPHLSLVDTTVGPGEKQDQRDLAAFYLQRARRLLDQQQEREAMDELHRCIYIAPYHAEAHLLLGRIHLRAGRLQEAKEALKISLWSQETVEAHVALAEAYVQSKELLEAQTEADKALTLKPDSPEARAIRERIGKLTGRGM